MTVYEKKLVQEALQYYSCSRAEIHFLRHNENITCKVAEQGESYVLRIHAPVPGFSPGLYEENSLVDQMKAEVELLLHLSQTAPFPVQTPVKNRLGEYITALSGGIPCQLLRWVEGEPLSRIVDCDGKKRVGDQYAEDLGIMAAQIHEAARGYAGDRLMYSHKLVKKMCAELDTACKKAHISREHQCVCQKVLERVDQIMTLLDLCPDAGSLVHADLSLGNVLRTSSGLAPIDFSLSGFGYRALECGMLAANFEDPKAQERMRLGYEEESGIVIEPLHMEAFLAFSILLFITAQHNRFGREKWFWDSMNRWTRGIFARTL